MKLFDKTYKLIITQLIEGKNISFIENILNEGISSFIYKIPDDKEKLLYDFYLLTALPIWNITGNLDDKGRATTLPHRQSEELVTAAVEAQEKIVNFLKKQHLKDVLFSISAEFRHILALNDPKSLVEFAKEYGLVNQFKNYVLNYDYRDTGKKEFIPKLKKIRTEYDKDNSRNYLNSYKSILSSFDDLEGFVEFASGCFRKLDWRQGYGGEPWAKICDAWIKLHNAKKYNDKVVWIDHIFDLQHNTDTVFNKIKEYSKRGGYQWLAGALDFKRDAKSLFDLAERASPSVKTFTARILKASTGETLESWTKQKDINNNAPIEKEAEKTPKNFLNNKNKNKNKIGEKNGTYKRSDGSLAWYKDGKLHREDGPAVKWSNSKGDWIEEWYIEGKRHRIDGPAIEYGNGYKSWWIDGKLHRTDGPAVEWANGDKSWYIDGVEYTESGYLKKILEM